jgi:tetratricopeptide (TPR) repeat protein
MHSFCPDSIQITIERLSKLLSVKMIDHTINPDKRRDVRNIIHALNKVFQTTATRSEFNSNNENDAFIKIGNVLTQLIIPPTFYKSSYYLFKLLISDSEIHVMLNQPDQAIASYQKAIALAQKTSDNDLAALIQLKLGQLFLDYHDVDSAIEQIDAAIVYYKHTENLQYLIDCYWSLGLAQQYCADYNNAIDLFEQSLELAEKMTDTFLIAKIKLSIGIVNRIIGNNQKSIRLLEESKTRFNELKKIDGAIDSLHQLSLTHLQNSCYQKAISGFNECLMLCDKYHIESLKAHIHLNRAAFYLEVNDPCNAARSCTEAFHYVISGNSAILLVKACTILGKIFDLMNHPAIARELYKESRNIHHLLVPAAKQVRDQSNDLVVWSGSEQLDEAIESKLPGQQIYFDFKLNHYVEFPDQCITSMKHVIHATETALPLT